MSIWTQVSYTDELSNAVDRIKCLFKLHTGKLTSLIGSYFVEAIESRYQGKDSSLYNKEAGLRSSTDGLKRVSSGKAECGIGSPSKTAMQG